LFSQHCLYLFNQFHKQTQLSRRWKALTPEDRQPYLDAHSADVQRFRQESHAADVAALAAVEAKRAALEVQDDETPQGRAARAAADQERAVREERRRRLAEAAANDTSEEAMRRREVAAQKKREVEERRAKRDEEEKALAKQHKKLAKEEQKKASNRLEYLLKQSNIFARLQGGKGTLMGDEEKDGSATATDDGDQKPAARKDGAHHVHRPESADSDNGEGDEDEDETRQHVFLTKQPSVIKFGQLKPYQLESLNWMIHLAEKGLNGILADGTLSGCLL